jgi:hypothetical protein
MTDSSIWDQEVTVPKTVISYVDPSVLESKGTDIRHHGPVNTNFHRTPHGIFNQRDHFPWGFVLDSHSTYSRT